jgi:hypothetical protein
VDEDISSVKLPHVLLLALEEPTYEILPGNGVEPALRDAFHAILNRM